MKNIFNSIAVSLLLALAVLVAVPASGQTIVSNTTFAAAVTSTSQTTVRVALATGITANNTMLFADGEAMFVNAVNGTTISVTRGQPTSRAVQHPNGGLVWFGPPSQFQFATPVGYPAGACTRTGATLPYIDVNNNVISDCLGGVWVNGSNDPLGATIVFSPVPGGSVLTGVGTSTATTNTSMYCSEIYLPKNKMLTGLQILNGTVTTNGHRDVALYDFAGTLLAKSATTTTTGTASVYQAFAFTAQYYAVGPARYVGCSQAASSSDTLNLVVTADGNAGLLTQIYTGQTYGTIPATITAPSAYTTAQGPYFAFY